MDSSELVYKCVRLIGTSVSAWWRRFVSGGFSFREFKIKSWSEIFSGVGFVCTRLGFGGFKVGTRLGFEEIKVCTRWLLLLLGCGGGGVWVDWHHLRMADLRARLGMRVEKSGVVPSGS